MNSGSGTQQTSMHLDPGLAVVAEGMPRLEALVRLEAILAAGEAYVHSDVLCALLT